MFQPLKSKTGDELLESASAVSTDIDEKTSTNFKDSSNVNSDHLELSLSPADEARIKRDLAEEESLQSRKALFDKLQYCIVPLAWLIGICIAGLSGFWGYKISSVSEPIGQIREKILNSEKVLNKLELKIDKVESQLNITREEFLKQKK